VKLPAALLAIAAFGASAAATAAPLPKDPGSDDLRALRSFSTCMAKHHGWQAAKLLELDYRSADYRNRMKALAKSDPNCALNGRMRFGGLLFAGNLAEALLEARASGGKLAGAIAYDPARPAIAARDEGEYLGLCTARTAPDDVAALLAARPGTPAEDQALQSLAPHLAPCLKAGAQAKFNAPGLRAVIALGAYRLVQQNKNAALAAGGN
jgi:hypothetical protein